LTALLAPLKAHPRVRHFRRQGMIWAFDVMGAPADFSRRFFSAALANELLLRPIGNTVYLMPPYVLDDAEAELLAAGILATLNSVLA
ncbi:MAG TPA: adenosylmethionine--8-amino-7-oxononanoate aminotransferase BioA, partial [Rhodocyclaceae bacterium]